MGYDWDDKRDVCFRLYVEQRKSLEEVVDHFRDKLEFVPSKRTFQTQFRRWGFPTKLDYSHKDATVVQRVREMWEKNVMQKDMLPILHAEGFNVTESGLTRLRAKHGMHLKSANGTRAGMEGGVEGENAGSELLGIQDEVQTNAANMPVQPISKPRERVRKRKRRTEGELEASSGAPRYPSETTIGDAQKFLALTEDMYHEVRDQFRSICEQNGIIKKTICGPERWEGAKNMLVQANAHLQQLFMSSHSSIQQPLVLSLDIICMDVTKHMRVQSKTMSLGEAKNTLGLNPLEARVLKTRLIDILRANNFVNTYESDNWVGLKELWLQDTPLKARMPADDGPERERFQKALQLVCRDTLKRWREAQRKARENGESEGAALTSAVAKSPPAASARHQSSSSGDKQARRGRKSKTSAPDNTASEPRIDPSLLQAATSSGSHADTTHGVGTYPLPDAMDFALEPPLAVYFRRAPGTAEIGVPPLWLGVLSTRTLTGLHTAALNFPSGPDYSILKLEGVMPSPTGGELLYQIDQDDELQGYLLGSEGSKASFVVHLTPRS